MAATTKQPGLLYTPAEATKATDQAVAGADTARVAALGTMALVQQARAQVLGREAARLEQLGDPRAAAVAAAVQATQILGRQLQLEASRGAAVAPPPTDNAAKVEGHVLDESMRPVAGATVQVLDATGKQLRGASATTDGNGYFVVEWKPPPATGKAQAPAVRLRVTAGKTRVQEEPAPRTQPAGTVEYAQFVVPETSDYGGTPSPSRQ
jgi:hypothetical protein